MELNEAEVGISVFKNLGSRLVGVSEASSSDWMVMSWAPAETKSWNVRPSFLMASRTEFNDEDASDEANRELGVSGRGGMKTLLMRYLELAIL